jgi:hypothetical protein
MGTTQRFNLRSYGDDFQTGRCANGDQVLMGLLCPNLVLFRFDREGTLIGRELRPWSFPARRVGGIYEIFDPMFRTRLGEQITTWQAELGFSEEPITVCGFFDKEHWVGIDLPDDEPCAFIFWWAKDYWMNAAGKVVST